MNQDVTVLDYGVGNLFSVRRAFETSGANVHLTKDPQEVLKADRVVLPGVGAFADAMRGLKSSGFVEPILEYVKTGKPFLGICVGMQMLLDKSEEFGVHEGLGIIPGVVKRISDTTQNGEPLKVPHVGWNQIQKSENHKPWENTIFQGMSEDSFVYFVHSFTANPQSKDAALATAEYGGLKLVASVSHDNVYGCQFHPERSGPTGLKIIQNFLKLNP